MAIIMGCFFGVAASCLVCITIHGNATKFRGILVMAVVAGLFFYATVFCAIKAAEKTPLISDEIWIFSAIMFFLLGVPFALESAQSGLAKLKKEK